MIVDVLRIARADGGVSNGVVRPTDERWLFMSRDIRRAAVISHLGHRCNCLQRFLIVHRFVM